MAGIQFRAAHFALKLPLVQLSRPHRLVSNNFCRLHCPSQVLEQRPRQRGFCVSPQWSKQRGRAGHSLTATGPGRQLIKDRCQTLTSFAASVSNMADIESMDPVQKRLMFDDECILVDGDDQVVGHENKYNCHLWEKIESENLLHRAFSTFLFNSENKLLLQKRSATKVTFPLVWTNTCCSHPLYRESEMIAENDLGVKNAAVRKLYDELGIVAEDVPVSDFTCLGRIHYKAPSDGKWGEHEVDYLLFIKRDVRLEPNPDEVAEVEFVDRERLHELVRKADCNEDGIKLSPWFRLVVDRFLFDWWDRVEKGTLEEAVDMKTIHKL